MAEVWERRKGESSKTFSWFCVYRDLRANRTLENVIKSIQDDSKIHENSQGDENIMPVPTLDQLKKASSKWHWVERCRRYDNYIDEQQRLLKEQEYLQLEERLIDVGNRLVDVVEKNIRNLEDNFDDSKHTSIAHAIASDAKAFDSTVKNVRLLYGRSTEIKDEKVEASIDAEVDTNTHVDVTSDDFMENELEFMKELIDKRRKQ